MAVATTELREAPASATGAEVDDLRLGIVGAGNSARRSPAPPSRPATPSQSRDRARPTTSR